MNLQATVIVLLGAAALGTPARIHAQTRTAEQPFVSGGTVTIRLDGGDYEVRPSVDNRVRVTLTGNTGKATTEVTVAGTRANVSVLNTPHSNFHGLIEIPKAADIILDLTGGDLSVGLIVGNKDIRATAGDVKIAVGSPDDYASVDARVTIGDLSGGPFGGSDGGVLGHALKWTGKGKYTLRARLGAGDLSLK